jgi:VanZ family protein
MINNLLPAIIWAIITGVFCVVPLGNMPDTPICKFFSFDKIAHVLFFAILTYLLALGFKKHKTNRSLYNHGIKVAFLIAGFYGVVLEVVQYTMIDSRSIELSDITADIAGCLSGIFVFYLIYGKVLAERNKN